MHVTVNFKGIIEEVLQNAVKKGIAKTKTEALRLGVLELNNRYHLLEDDYKKELAVKKMQKIDRKGKFLTLSQVKKKYPNVF